MKSFVTCVLAIFGSTALLSCGEKKQEVAVHETPAALQDNKVSLKSYSRSWKDLTEELYAGLVEQNPSLKKLEEDLNAYNIKPGLLNEAFENYNSKSITYYASANNKAETIRDSVLKQKIVALIARSNERYLKKTNSITELLNHISENNMDINDHHTVLKIALTLPLMETYQSDNAIDQKDFKDLIKEQEELLKQADKHMPEF